jgi:hypothetical protein
MKLVIKYKDKWTRAPKVVMDDDGKIEEVIFDVPFALVQKSIVNEDGDRQITVIVSRTKQCTNCKEERTADQFHGASTHRDGKQNVCIICKKQLDRERRRKRLEEEDEAQ